MVAILTLGILTVLLAFYVETYKGISCSLIGAAMLCIGYFSIGYAMRHLLV